MKRVKEYRIGVEVETVLSGYDCETCDYCVICEECPICEYCRGDMEFCENCDIENTRVYIIDNGIVENAEKLDDRDICRICRDYALWQELICEACYPCDSCDYYRNPEYCSYESDYYNYRDNLDDIVTNIYDDGSCGLEFVTKPFTSLKQLRKGLQRIIEEIGEENISTKEYCGGHTNISWENWEEKAENTAEKILFYSDLLTYMFCDKDTWTRDNYKVFPNSLKTLKEDIYKKYTCVHIKDYAVEIRFPDSPKDVDNHVLLSAILLSLSFSPINIKFNSYDFDKTKTIYNKINKYGEKLNKDEKRYLSEKFKALLKIVRPYLKEFSKELNADLEKALIHRFKNPKYEEEKESFMNLEEFPLKTKTINVETPITQKTLAEFLA